MLTLLIETSTEKGCVFIFDEERLVFEEYLPPGLHNSAALMPAVERGLAALQIPLKRIGLIGVGIGPGSYTGLRVGAMAAKTLSFASHIPLVGLCTLECFDSQANVPFAAIIDAKIGGAYLLAANNIPIVCPLEELPLHLKGISQLVTPSSKAFIHKVSLLHPSVNWTWEENVPNPLAMLKVALHKFKQSSYSLDGSVDLLYLRKTQAEIEKEKS
jgi:tRNA threonylcarbamoyladenosine biosynthesis protein TsaB